MKGKNITKLTASVMSAAMACTGIAQSVFAVPVIAADTAAAGKVIFSSDFEDAVTSGFSNRGGDDTTEISISDEKAKSGSKRRRTVRGPKAQPAAPAPQAEQKPKQQPQKAKPQKQSRPAHRRSAPAQKSEGSEGKSLIHPYYLSDSKGKR